MVNPAAHICHHFRYSYWRRVRKRQQGHRSTKIKWRLGAKDIHLKQRQSKRELQKVLALPPSLFTQTMPPVQHISVIKLHFVPEDKHGPQQFRTRPTWLKWNPNGNNSNNSSIVPSKVPSSTEHYLCGVSINIHHRWKTYPGRLRYNILNMNNHHQYQHPLSIQTTIINTDRTWPTWNHQSSPLQDATHGFILHKCSRKRNWIKKLRSFKHRALEWAVCKLLFQ